MPKKKLYKFNCPHCGEEIVMDAEQRKKFFAIQGRKGGLTTAKRIPKEVRSKMNRKAVEARWKKYRENKGTEGRTD